MSKKNIGHITLRGGHTLILGNIPEVIDVNKLEEANVLGSNVDIEKFGLFETSSPLSVCMASEKNDFNKNVPNSV